MSLSHSYTMPLFKQLQVAGSEILIWHITEEEQYFVAQSGLISNKIHLKKRLEFLSSRYCLKLLLPQIDLSDIAKDDEGKPYLLSHNVQFSISHSYPYVAVAVHPAKAIGIDIQTLQEKILRLQPKFLAPEEMALCHNDIRHITAAWCCKEAMYKKYALGGLDFRIHMPITRLDLQEDRGHAIIHFHKGTARYPQEFYIEAGSDHTIAVTI